MIAETVMHRIPRTPIAFLVPTAALLLYFSGIVVLPTSPFDSPPYRSQWEYHLPPGNTGHDWCPTHQSEGGKFVQSQFELAASGRQTTCADMQRIGGSGDGGKWICIDDIRLGDCIVYSLGSRLDFTFESDVVKRLGCSVHTFDCTVGTPPAKNIPEGVVFHPWCVGGNDEIKSISSDLGHQGKLGQYYTLITIRETLGHTTIDLLKMDIERHEFTVVETLKTEAAPHQISFEAHLHNGYGMWGRPVLECEWRSLWATLDGLGFGIFAHEPNTMCYCCCEFSMRKMSTTTKSVIVGALDRS